MPLHNTLGSIRIFLEGEYRDAMRRYEGDVIDQRLRAVLIAELQGSADRAAYADIIPRVRVSLGDIDPASPVQNPVFPFGLSFYTYETLAPQQNTGPARLTTPEQVHQHVHGRILAYVQTLTTPLPHELYNVRRAVQNILDRARDANNSIAVTVMASRRTDNTIAFTFTAPRCEAYVHHYAAPIDVRSRVRTAMDLHREEGNGPLEFTTTHNTLRAGLRESIDEYFSRLSTSGVMTNAVP